MAVQNELKLACRACGCRVSVDGLKGDPPCSHPGADAHGFIVERVNVVFGGLCSGCQAARGRKSA
jgi:Fur family ferric uptake transcriptional regulator